MNNDAINVNHIEGLINKEQLQDVVASLVSFYSGKIAALEQRIATLEKLNVFVVAEETPTE